MGTFVYPNLQNTQLATLARGNMHMPSQYLSQGRSLDPMQRHGLVSPVGLPVQPASSGSTWHGDAHTPPTRLLVNPTIAFAGNTSHTRMWPFHI